MSNRRKITIAILVIMTILLGVFGIYLSIKLKNGQAPQDSLAANWRCCGCGMVSDPANCYPCQPGGGSACKGSNYCGGGSTTTGGGTSGGSTTGGGSTTTGGSSGGGGINCPSGCCADGFCYGADAHAPQANCTQRANEACSSHGGTGGGGGTTTGGGGGGTCDANSSASCRGKAVGTQNTYGSGSSAGCCTCSQNIGTSSCSCNIGCGGVATGGGGGSGTQCSCSNIGYSGCSANVDGSTGCGSQTVRQACSIACGGAGSKNCSNPTGTYSQQWCDPSCGAGKGKVCQYDGSWSSCLRADACGSTGNQGAGSSCTYDSQCSSGVCSCTKTGFICANNSGTCASGSNGNAACSNFSGYSVGSFLGCGNAVSGGDGNRCHNCFATAGSGGQCGVYCDPNSTLSCGLGLGCGAASSSSSSIPSTNTTTTGTTTGQSSSSSSSIPPQPYCGDAKCQTNEKCERTSAGASTYKACTGATDSAPTGATVNSCYGVQYNQPVVNGQTCVYCGDSIYTPGIEQCDATAPNGNGNDATHCNSDCTLQPTANSCQSLSKNGDPVNAGPGNLVSFTLVYKYTGSTNPFPNIRLKVSSSPYVSSNPGVGRQFVPGGSGPYPNGNLVAPNSTPTYDSVNQQWTYNFVWEAASPTNTPVPNGTYDVRVLSTGVNGSELPGPCTESITVNTSTPQNPLFTLLKQSAPVCATNGDAIITYTITVTNVGPVSGTVTSVVDTYDATAASLGLNPTNITPSFGTVGGGKVTWTGNVSALTFAPQESKQFTYQIRIPKNELINFINSGLMNHVQVTYSTSSSSNNSVTFDLRTMLTCSPPNIPNTGIWDDSKLLLIGIFFILLGYATYKFKIGKNLSEKIINSLAGNVNNIKNSIVPFEESTEEKLDKKRKSK